MTDFPSGVSSPGAPSYASPLLDFSPIGNIEQDVMRGQQDRLKVQSQRAFRNGIPKTPDGQNDYKAMTEKMIELGDFGTASAMGNLGYQQGSLDQLKSNPEIVGYGKPQQGGAAPPAGPAQPSGSPAVPRDERPARPDNNGGFSQPTGATDTGTEPVAATSKLAPQFRAEIDRRNQGDFETRKRNLGALMASPFPGVKDYAKALLESLLKEQESTPAEKERRSGTTQYGADVKVDADNRTATPEMKNVRPGSGPGGKSAAQVASDIKLEEENRKLTPESKNTQPAPGVSPAQAAERIKTRGALDTKAGEGSIKKWEDDYSGLQAAGQSSFNAIQKADLAKNLTMVPGYYSGPLQPTTLMYQQFKSTFGADPTSALPQEAFQKVTTDMLTEQIKALGKSGVGRVLLAEVQNMQKGLASLGISAAGNRAQLEIFKRVSTQSQGLAKIAQDIAADQSILPEKKSEALNVAAQEFYLTHPVFTDAEKRDPRILSAPDAPPQLAKAQAPQIRAWAQSVGLSPGNLVKVNGQIVAVP